MERIHAYKNAVPCRQAPNSCHTWNFIIPLPLDTCPSIMTFQQCGDSKSVVNGPPSYTATSTSALVESLQHRRFPFLSSGQARNTVLSCIWDVVSAPDFTSSSVVPIINACAAALSAAEFSDLMQAHNIEGHTALYWAIVNERQEAISGLSGFIPKFSAACSSDLRLACMTTGDQALFSQLNLGNLNCRW